MLPTRFGVKALAFLALLFAAFFVSPYSNLFFLQLAFFCVFLVASALWCAGNLAGIGGRVLLPRPIAAGSTDASLTAELSAGRRTGRSISLALRLADGTRIQLRDSFDVPSRQVVTVEGGLPPMRRGVHRIATAHARSSFPFGMFRCRRRLTCEVELAVHPRPVEIAGARGAGAAATFAALDGTSLAPGHDVVGHLREWRSGDSLRNVHWRATARRGRPLVKERDGDAGAGVAVVLDRRGDPERVEVALAELATLAIAARERAEPIEVLSQGSHVRYGEAAQPLDDLLRWLAAADVLASDAPPPPSGPSGCLRLPRANGARRPVEEPVVAAR